MAWLCNGCKSQGDAGTEFLKLYKKQEGDLNHPKLSKKTKKIKSHGMIKDLADLISHYIYL